MPGIFESQSRTSLMAMLAMAENLNRKGLITGVHGGTGFRNALLVDTAISDSCAQDGFLTLGSSILPVSSSSSNMTAMTIAKHGIQDLEPEDVLGLQIYRYHPLIIISALLPHTVLKTFADGQVTTIERISDHRLIPVFNKALGPLLGQLVDIGGMIRTAGDQFVRRSAFLISPDRPINT